MKEPEILITIEGAEERIEVVGAQGPECRKLSQPFVDLFEVEASKNKPEYYQAPSQRQQVKRGG